MESLPGDLQNRVAEYLREYIQDLQEQLQWNYLFKLT